MSPAPEPAPTEDEAVGVGGTKKGEEAEAKAMAEEVEGVCGDGVVREGVAAPEPVPPLVERLRSRSFLTQSLVKALTLEAFSADRTS